jgi:excisionase family DNA binding protein
MGTRPTRLIRNLREHDDSYVTPAQLADYWNVSRKQIYKQIEAGTLKVIRFGPRLMRIRIVDAIEFEAAARMVRSDRDCHTAPDAHPRVEAPYAVPIQSERPCAMADRSLACDGDTAQRGGAMIERRRKTWG